MRRDNTFGIHPTERGIGRVVKLTAGGGHLLISFDRLNRLGHT